jgi:hypothetical protein
MAIIQMAVIQDEGSYILNMRCDVAVRLGRIFLGSAALAVMIIVSVPGDAGAVPISGSFSGTAAGSRFRLPNGEFSNFNGETVTGTFQIDPALIPGDPPYLISPESPDGQSASFLHSGAPYASLSFTAHGEKVNFATGGLSSDFLTLVSTSQGQQVNFGIGETYPYNNASLTLAGPPGSLFDPFIPQTLHVDADTFLSSVSFFFSRDFGASVVGLTVQFNEAATTVPEPGILGLIGAGMVGLAGLGARPRRRARIPLSSRTIAS